MAHKEAYDEEEVKMFMDGGYSGKLFLDFEVLHDEHGGQVRDELWISDSAASRRMSPSAVHKFNYQKCSNRFVIAACGTRLPVVGHSDLHMAFRSGEGLFNVSLLRNTAHEPRLTHYSYLFSVRVMVDRGHEYRGSNEAVSVFLNSGRSLLLPSKGNFNNVFGCRDK